MSRGRRPPRARLGARSHLRAKPALADLAICQARFRLDGGRRKGDGLPSAQDWMRALVFLAAVAATMRLVAPAPMRDGRIDHAPVRGFLAKHELAVSRLPASWRNPSGFIAPASLLGGAVVSRSDHRGRRIRPQQPTALDARPPRRGSSDRIRAVRVSPTARERCSPGSSRIDLVAGKPVARAAIVEHFQPGIAAVRRATRFSERGQWAMVAAIVSETLLAFGRGDEAEDRALGLMTPFWPRELP